ncbi:MAG: hypothetical protein AAB795_01250 [Patescibacteria group bacterium]
MNVSERYKIRRKKLLWHRAILIFALFLFLWLIFWGSFWISFFRIKSVEIDGTLELKKTNILVLEYLNGLNKFFIPKNNFFIVDTNEIEQLIKTQNLGVAVTKKHFPHTIKISFPEREAHFIICALNDICYYVNEAGLVYSESPQFSDYPLPLIVIKQNSVLQKDSALISLGDYFTNKNNVQYLNTLMLGLSKLDIETKIIEITNQNQSRAPFNFNEIKIFTPKEWYIYLDLQISAEVAINNIKLLFEQKIKNDKDKLQYIDMRFENKAFYMLY